MIWSMKVEEWWIRWIEWLDSLTEPLISLLKNLRELNKKLIIKIMKNQSQRKMQTIRPKVVHIKWWEEEILSTIFMMLIIILRTFSINPKYSEDLTDKSVDFMMSFWITHISMQLKKSLWLLKRNISTDQFRLKLR